MIKRKNKKQKSAISWARNSQRTKTSVIVLIIILVGLLSLIVFNSFNTKAVGTKLPGIWYDRISGHYATDVAAVEYSGILNDLATGAIDEAVLNTPPNAPFHFTDDSSFVPPGDYGGCSSFLAPSLSGRSICDIGGVFGVAEPFVLYIPNDPAIGDFGINGTEDVDMITWFFGPSPSFPTRQTILITSSGTAGLIAYINGLGGLPIKIVSVIPSAFVAQGAGEDYIINPDYFISDSFQPLLDPLFPSDPFLSIDNSAISVSFWGGDGIGGARDDVAPGAINISTAAAGSGSGKVNLTWTATGDDGAVGTAHSYIVKYSASSITDDIDFGLAAEYSQAWAPEASGGVENRIVDGLNPSGVYYFSVKACDEYNTCGAYGNTMSAAASFFPPAYSLPTPPPAEISLPEEIPQPIPNIPIEEVTEEVTEEVVPLPVVENIPPIQQPPTTPKPMPQKLPIIPKKPIPQEPEPVLPKPTPISTPAEPGQLKTTIQKIEEIATNFGTPLASVVLAVTLALSFAAVASSFIDFLAILRHLITLLLQFLGIKRKNKNWGIVYDSITKEPLPLSIVRLFDAKTKILSQTTVTDSKGRFGLFPAIGNYYLTVAKPIFSFPSRFLRGISYDVGYSSLYFGGKKFLSGKSIINFAIPLDKFSSRKKSARTLTAIHSFLVSLSTPVAIIGTLLSLIILVINPTIANSVILVFYVLFLSLKKLFLSPPKKPSVKVINYQTKKPMPKLAIKIYSKKYKKLIAAKVSDKNGRFNLFLPDGEYFLKTSLNRYSFISKKELKNGYNGGTLTVEDKNPFLGINIYLRKQV